MGTSSGLPKKIGIALAAAVADQARKYADSKLRGYAKKVNAQTLKIANVPLNTPSRTDIQYATRRGRKPRRISGFGGRLGGFMKKPRRTKMWPKSKVKRSALRTLAKIQAEGVLSTKEIGISTLGVSDAVYLGHATFAMDQYRDVIVSLIIKKLFMLVNQRIRNWNDPIDLITNDQIVFEYKSDQDSLTGAATVNYLYGGGVVTYQQVVDYFVANFLWNQTDKILTRVYFNFLGGAGNSRVRSLNLDYATVEIYVKSSMKLQNATTSGAGTEADEVDNVPVNGKNYYGHGNGSNSNRTNRTEEQFWARQDCGWMKKVPSSTSGLYEMPTAVYFRGVKKMGKHRIDPGRIRTSVLKDHYRVSLRWLITKITQSADHTTDVSDVGKFRIFGFEHVIKAASDSPNIKILGEVNYQIGMAMSTKNSNVTDQKTAQAYVTY